MAVHRATTISLAPRPLMLASVTSASEAAICVAAGADIIDAKNPLSGALGALDCATVREIAGQAHAGGLDVSATIGDLACDPGIIGPAVDAMAATGIDFVKTGLLPGGDPYGVIADLGRRSVHPTRLVGVVFADLGPDLNLIEAMADAGFAGVLIDTADKTRGSLTSLMAAPAIAEFIARAHAGGLFAGLAGSLKMADIEPLCRLRPDILGFRGALCLDSRRTFAIDDKLVGEIRARIEAARTTASCAAG